MRVETEARRSVAPEPAGLVPGDAFYELSQRFRDLISRRAYELFELRGSADGYDREDWLQAETEILQSVPVEVTESESAVTVSAEVPGFTEKDLEVRVAPRAVCISGARQEVSREKDESGSPVEQRSSQIFRALELPCEIDPSRVGAIVSNGILELSLLKVGVGKKIPVSGKAASA